MAPGAKTNTKDDLQAAAAQPPLVPAGGLDVPPSPQRLEVESFPGESRLPEDERDRQLVLHFALPRTIMTCDMSAGRSTETELNEVLSEMAWGSLDSTSGEWVLESQTPSLDPPSETVINYAEYVARSFPSDASTVPDEEEQRQNQEAAAAKRAVFTNAGEPGADFRPFFEQMVKSLAITNKTLAKAYDIKKPILDEQDVPEDPSRTDAQAIMRYGRHQVLPAFWQLLVSLTKKRRYFKLVLRSFSQEQLLVMQRELQLFCQGQHPAHCGQNKTQKPPLMNGEKNSRDMRLADGFIGHVDRTKGQLEFTCLGPVAQAESSAPSEVLGATPAQPPGPTIYAFPPFHEAYAGLQEQVLALANTVALVDDYAYWQQNKKVATAGKLFLVDHAGGLAETKVQHIFFDGAIGQHDARCIDVRDVVDGESLPLPEVNGMFLHHVDLYRASTEDEYFITALEACERKMSQQILQSRHVATPLESTAAASASPQGNEEEKQTHKEWLNRNIIPALLPAMEACQRDRPADPIEFIAFYMLRHRGQYSKSLKG
mmetsp:Transcript_69928/g.138472  ORF Transcript_69928/g.138472 Transcript_69928/m.138472 type:complete len:543 (+) Transcript_69928:70-1698(+)